MKAIQLFIVMYAIFKYISFSDFHANLTNQPNYLMVISDCSYSFMDGN